MKRSSKKRRKKVWTNVLIFLCVIFSALIIAGVVFFGVNRFSLKLELSGEEKIVISAGEQVPEPVAEAYVVGSLFFREGFPVDAQILVRGEADTAVPGTYEIIWDASWQWLSATQKRVIVVQDTQAPVITLTHVPGACTLPGEEYEEEGFAAWDDCDGDITDRVVREFGEGIVIYTVTDQAGNETSVSREICNYDSYAPELILTGGTTWYIKAGEDYTDPGWTALDNHDGDLSSFVQVTGTIDKYLAGTYPYTYTVSDASGNVSEVVRTVVVEAHERPETVIPEEKVIYLTFDDGPSKYTQRLLDVLDAYNAKATFFVVDSEYSDLLKEIVDRGHSIGIHSVKHNYKQIYSSAEAYFEDILTMQQIIYEETGVMTYLMRFPGGSSNTVSSFNPGIMTYLTQAVQDNGFNYYDWNVDSMDAGGAASSAEVAQNIRSGVKYHGHIAVVLQHDTCGYSVSAVEQILIWGLANGYDFRGLDMTSPTAHQKVEN